MKTISLIGVALALCVPALASAQRGGGGAVAVLRGAIQRVDVQRVDRTLVPGREIEIRRGDVVRGETGTRIRRPDPDRRRLHNPARRRWNAAHPSNPHLARRRWYNATHPSTSDRSRRRGR